MCALQISRRLLIKIALARRRSLLPVYNAMRRAPVIFVPGAASPLRLDNLIFSQRGRREEERNLSPTGEEEEEEAAGQALAFLAPERSQCSSALFCLRERLTRRQRQHASSCDSRPNCGQKSLYSAPRWWPYKGDPIKAALGPTLFAADQLIEKRYTLTYL